MVENLIRIECDSQYCNKSFYTFHSNTIYCCPHCGHLITKIRRDKEYILKEKDSNEENQ